MKQNLLKTKPKIILIRASFAALITLISLTALNYQAVAQEITPDTKQQFEKLDFRDPDLNINPENLNKYESLLLPQMAEFILALNLKLKINSSQMQLTQSAETYSKESFISAVKNFPKAELIELDQDLSILSQNSQQQIKSQTIQSSTTHYSAKAEQQAKLIFKEKFSILSPANLNKLKLLNIRPAGSNDDLIWYFSPTLNKSIELVSSNRSDFLFNSLFSLEDIFISDLKYDVLNLVDLRLIDVLIPTLSEDLFKYEKSPESSCDSFSSSSADVNKLSEVISLNRQQVIVVDFKNSDAFSSVGRYRLYFDANKLTPILKEEYSYQGELRKSVFSFSAFNASKQQIPVVSVIIAGNKLTKGSKNPILINTINGRLCQQLPQDFNLAELDPSGYWK